MRRKGEMEQKADGLATPQDAVKPSKDGGSQ